MAVVLLGHSYVRRLKELLTRRPRMRNIAPEVQPHFIGIGGARLSLQGDKSIFRSSYLNNVRAANPEVIYIHIGENDLRSMAADLIVDRIVLLVRRLIDDCHPRAVIVSQLTVFPCNEDLSHLSRYVNQELVGYYEQHQPQDCLVRVWRHEIGIFGPNRRSRYRDEAHLNDDAMERYSRSVGTVINRTRRSLLL